MRQDERDQFRDVLQKPNKNNKTWKNTMKKIPALLGALALSLPMMSNAQISGYDVLLVNGFDMGQLTSQPANAAAVYDEAVGYWDAKYWGDKAEGYLAWDSSDRLEGSSGVAVEAADWLAHYVSQEGRCISSNPCVLVTHSTGDLVVRYVLSNKESLLDGKLTDAQIADIDVVSILDFAGAGGGTELASAAVTVFDGASSALSTLDSMIKLVSGWSLNDALTSAIGVDVSSVNALGIMNDLQPSTARSHATSSIEAIPRLRFVGTGDYAVYGWITNLIIQGSGDSTVPLHSACGSASTGSYASCAKNVSIEGESTSVSAPSNLWDYHYPTLMGESVDHSQIVGTTTGKSLVYLSTVPGGNVGGMDTSFDTYTETKTVKFQVTSSNWWKFWTWWDTTYYYYEKVQDTGNRSVSGVVFDTLNT